MTPPSRIPSRRLGKVTILLFAWVLSGARLGAQEPEPSSVEDKQEAGEASVDPPARRLVRWNEFEGPFFTLRASAGVILDAGTYAQDEASREQFELEPDWQVRDFRVMLNGRITHEAARVGDLEPMYKLLTGKAPNPVAAVKLAYLEILTRQPTAAELSEGQQIIGESATPLDGMADLRWVLLNCNEFRFLP